MRAFHRPRIADLVASGVDLLACETIPSMPETKALMGLLEDEFPDTLAWFSITLKDARHISDGAPLAEVVSCLERPQVVAVGVNCVPQHLVGAALRCFSALTRKPLLVYPNSGEIYDARGKFGCKGVKGNRGNCQGRKPVILASTSLV